MTDETISHPETGEILYSEEPAPVVPSPVDATLGAAIHALIADLPIWITQDAEATISGTTKRKYATLKAVMATVRPLAMKHGIRIRQGCEHAWQLDTAQGKGRMVPVFTDLIHTASGQVERTTIEIPITKLDAQGMGSAISYGRRYGLLAALGLTTDETEDDGAATAKRDITSEAVDSQDLWVIKEEIAACTNLADLTAWGTKANEKGRVERLNDVEAHAARIAFSDRLRTLRFAPAKKDDKK